MARVRLTADFNERVTSRIFRYHKEGAEVTVRESTAQTLISQGRAVRLDHEQPLPEEDMSDPKPPPDPPPADPPPGTPPEDPPTPTTDDSVVVKDRDVNDA